MRPICVSLCLLVLCIAVPCCTAEEVPTPDPFDTLIATTTQMAELAQTLKPLANNVATQKETVARKEAELADAKAAENTAAVTFNQTLRDLITSIDALRDAVLTIPVLEEEVAPDEPPVADPPVDDPPLAPPSVE